MERTERIRLRTVVILPTLRAVVIQQTALTPHQAETQQPSARQIRCAILAQVLVRRSDRVMRTKEIVTLTKIVKVIWFVDLIA
jgi:hypothetical protein